MKTIFTFKDEHLGSYYVVIPKIREISKGLGSVVITYDNGDKRNIESNETEKLMLELVKAIEEYYSYKL